jgi:hypothetical protein
MIRKEVSNMPCITLYTFDKAFSLRELWVALKNAKLNGGWITSRPSKYNKQELFIQYWWYEDIDDSVKKVFSEEEAEDIVTFLKQNGKNKVLKRVYCFINLLTRTLEIYRGPDSKTEEIVAGLEKILGTKFKPLKLSSEDLQKIYTNHSLELKQAMFKNMEGLIYEVLRGRMLENNEKFKEYMQKFSNCLRVISFRPNIKFLNGGCKYQVTLNGDKGTVRLSGNGIFKWRPRYEIRQIIFLIAATLGILAQ